VTDSNSSRTRKPNIAPAEHDPIPVGAAVEAIYYDIRESFELAMQGAGINQTKVALVLATVDDAIGNDANFDELLSHLEEAGVDVGEFE